MTDGAITPEFTSFAALVKDRRTNLKIDVTRAVDPALITAVCELAVWAPNHRLTEPWRFTIITGDNRAELGARAAAYQAEMGETMEARLSKTRGKYLRAPVSVVIACAHDDNPEVDLENRDAVSAGIQNLLLGATTLGLASYWGSGLVTQAPGVKNLCDFAAEDQILGVIYLGWPTAPMVSPGRSAPRITWM